MRIPSIPAITRQETKFLSQSPIYCHGFIDCTGTHMGLFKKLCTQHAVPRLAIVNVRETSGRAPPIFGTTAEKRTISLDWIFLQRKLLWLIECERRRSCIINWISSPTVSLEATLILSGTRREGTFIDPACPKKSGSSAVFELRSLPRKIQFKL